MLPKTEDVEYLELAREVGDDGKEYIMRPLVWSLAKVSDYWNKFEPFHIFQNVHNEDEFLNLIAHMEGLWFELWDVGDSSVVGVMYLSDIIYDYVNGGITQATWHATMFDSKIAPRRNIARTAIARLMKMLKIHRLIAEIPVNIGGAIRAAKKIGFVQEGVMRRARKLRGSWYDVLLLSILDSEVEQWEAQQK